MRFTVYYGDDLGTLYGNSLGERTTYKDKQGRHWVYAEMLPFGDELILEQARISQKLAESF